MTLPFPPSHSAADRPVLITGGAGFIGSHLAERLLREGRRVIVLDDLSTGSRSNLTAIARHPQFSFIEARLSAYNQLPELVAQCQRVYHLAAAVGVDLVVSQPIRVLETNLHETEVLLEASAPSRTPMLITSTSEVYGKSREPAFSEDDDLLIGPPHQSRWSYACSKLMDEFLALAYHREKDLPVTIVRLFNTVGPRQTGRYGMVLPRFIAAARAGQPLRVFGDGLQTRCFCYVADAVEALVRLQRAPGAAGRIFNVGGTEEISIRDLAGRVIALLNSKSTIEFIPYSEAYAPGFDDMRRRRPVIGRLLQTTGFQPDTRLDEIIRRTAAAADDAHGNG